MGGLGATYCMVVAMLGSWWHPALFGFLCGAGAFTVGVAEIMKEGSFWGDCSGCQVLEHEIGQLKLHNCHMVETVCDLAEEIRATRKLPQLEDV